MQNLRTHLSKTHYIESTSGRSVRKETDETEEGQPPPHLPLGIVKSCLDGNIITSGSTLLLLPLTA